MPNGRLNPVAKVDVCSALPSLPTPRKTLISPLLISAKKTSPFGAARNSRGSSKPAAYNSTLNPGSALGIASAGRGYGSGKPFADFVARAEAGLSPLPCEWCPDSPRGSRRKAKRRSAPTAPQRGQEEPEPSIIATAGDCLVSFLTLQKKNVLHPWLLRHLQIQAASSSGSGMEDGGSLAGKLSSMVLSRLSSWCCW